MGRDGNPAGAQLTVLARALAARYPAARRDGRVALEGFDLDLAPGEIVGLLGPNAAGKTTALRLISTGRRPASGELAILGFDPWRSLNRVRRRIAFAGDEPVHLETLTGWENAVGFAMAAGLGRRDAVRRVEALLETFDLVADRHRPVAQYSLGMRRRLLLVEALAHEPALLILDEPTSGLDPGGRAVLAQVLRERAGAGTATLLATNDLAVAEGLCDRVQVLRLGRTVLEGRPADLVASLGGVTRYEFTLASSAAPEVVQAGVEVVLAAPERLVAHARDGDRGLGTGERSPLPALCEAIERCGASIRSVAVRRPGLADVFLKATGEEPPA